MRTIIRQKKKKNRAPFQNKSNIVFHLCFTLRLTSHGPDMDSKRDGCDPQAIKCPRLILITAKITFIFVSIELWLYMITHWLWKCQCIYCVEKTFLSHFNCPYPEINFPFKTLHWYFFFEISENFKIIREKYILLRQSQFFSPWLCMYS